MDLVRASGAGPMDAAEFEAALKACGWSRTAVVRRVGGSANDAYQWSAGFRPVPVEVADWLRQVALAVAALPPPPLRRLTPGAKRGGSYVLRLLASRGAPATVRELCEAALGIGRQASLMAMRQNVERLVGNGQIVRLPGLPVRYALPEGKAR